MADDTTPAALKDNSTFASRRAARTGGAKQITAAETDDKNINPKDTPVRTKTVRPRPEPSIENHPPASERGST
jgi:hypothetical protein